MKSIDLLLITLVSSLCLMISCKSADPMEAYKDLDLMSYGLPIKIKAPVGSVVESDNLGFIQDVTIKGDNNFYIQIQGGTATTTDISTIKTEYLSNIKNSKYFSRIIEEDESGFIYEKDLGDSNLNFDFRCIRIQGDKEYIFQRGLVGKYTLEEVKLMYDAVK